MARDGSGTYVLPPSNPVFPGTVIESDWANDTMSDLALAITQSIAYDGQTTPINDLPMGGFHHTNVSDATARNQYATLGVVQDGRQSRVNITSGVDNLLGTLVGGSTSYVAGSIISFFAPAVNTGPMTLNYNGIGARSIVSAAGLPLAAGDIQAGAFLLAIYDGSQFKLLSQVASTTPSEALAANTTGQERPPSGTYPQLTIATGTTINVPAGSAWIVPAGGGASTEVTWAAQTIALQFLTTSFSTTLAVDDTGTINQFAGRALGAALRNFAVIGVVTHPNAVATTVITRPAIFADDGYRGTDVASLLSNSIVSGGLVTGNGVALLQLDISAGSIFMPGGAANTVDSPNLYPIFQQNNIQFRTLAGANTVSVGVTANAPITQYDPNGAGVVVAIPANNDVVIHRLYYLYGSFIWVYGQRIFSSVENALSMLEWDRTQYRPSMFLQDAVLVAEIAARKAGASLSIITDAAIVAPGSINFSIGSPGGIAEAPIDGTPYGRQNAAWVQVLRSISPQITTDATITGAAPMLTEVVNPVGAGTSGLTVKSDVNNWFGLHVVNPDDKAYFRSYNPATGALRFTTTYDLATGGWDLPQNATFSGVGARIRGDFSGAVVANRLAFQSNAVNGGTNVPILPNGTSTQSALLVFNSSVPANSSFAMLYVDSAVTALISDKAGTGAYLPLLFNTGGAERFRLSATENRFQADFGNAVLANRFCFQTSVLNQTSSLMVLPNGTATQTQCSLFSRSDITANYNFFDMTCSDVEARLRTGAAGTAVAVPMTFHVGGAERIRVGGVGGGLTFGTDAAPLNGITGYSNGINLRSNLDFCPQFQASGFSNTAGSGPYFLLNRYRGTIAAPLPVTSGDALGQLYFGGQSSSTFVNSAGIWSSVDAAVAAASVPAALVFGTGTINAAERMRIASNGQVRIGSAVSIGNGQLEVVGNGITVHRSTAAAAGKWWHGPFVNASNAFSVLNQNLVGVSLADGATAWAAASDERLKDIIEPITGAVEKVKGVRSVIGKYKVDEPDTRRAFLIAQDFLKALPEAVYEDEDGNLVLKYTEVLPLFAAALNEMITRIEVLEAKCAGL